MDTPATTVCVLVAGEPEPSFALNVITREVLLHCAYKVIAPKGVEGVYEPSVT